MNDIAAKTTDGPIEGDFKPKLWVPGDLNAFFGFETKILVNLLTLTGLLRFVLKMPDDLVFTKILPEYLGVILVTAIPFGIYDLVEAMDNVESAASCTAGRSGWERRPPSR